jgi:CRP/FNR family cyclic AMP-dependent transcriptional regulator
MITSKTLAGINLFQDLPDDALSAISTLCQEVTFPAGADTLTMGTKADSLYLLQTGTVRLVLPTRQPEPLIITLLKSPGQVFGWSAIDEASHYIASAQAVTDVRAIAIDGPALISYLEQHPVVGFVVMGRIAQLASQRLALVRQLLLEAVREHYIPRAGIQEN